MSRFRHQLPTFMRIALLLLLLSMQSFTSAHELNQGTTHDSSLCASCSIGSGHNGIPSTAVGCPVNVSTGNQPVFAGIVAPQASLRQTPEARAPPITL